MKVVVAGFLALLSCLIITDCQIHLAFCTPCHRGTVLIHAPQQHIQTKEFICEKHMIYSKAEESITLWNQAASLCQGAIWKPAHTTAQFLNTGPSHGKSNTLVYTTAGTGEGDGSLWRVVTDFDLFNCFCIGKAIQNIELYIVQQRKTYHCYDVVFVNRSYSSSSVSMLFVSYFGKSIGLPRVLPPGRACTATWAAIAPLPTSNLPWRFCFIGTDSGHQQLSQGDGSVPSTWSHSSHK